MSNLNLASGVLKDTNCPNQRQKGPLLIGHGANPHRGPASEPARAPTTQ
jgi:hypothetical protein